MKISEIITEEYQQLDEVFNTQGNGVWSTSGFDDEMFEYNFTASNGARYRLDFMEPHIGPEEFSPYSFHDHEISDAAYETAKFVEFSQVTDDNPTGYTTKRGTGSSAEVFGIIVNAMIEFIKKYKPSMFYFQAVEPNRQRLYGAMAKKLTQTLPGWGMKQNGGQIAVFNKRKTADPAKSKTQAVAEDQLDEACWKGYRKDGMKTLFGKKYPNCVKVKKKTNEAQVDRAGNQDVAEDNQLSEVDFSSGLGELALSPEQIFNQSTVDGTIGSRKVYLFADGEHKIYFFMNDRKIDALVYMFDGRLMAMKNFSSNKGLIYNLFQYIINIKRQRVRLTSKDKLTSDGIEWIIDQIKRPSGFKITDKNGNNIDSSELYKEWENSRITGNTGPTEIVISESKNGKHLRENERRLMPMDIFGSTLKKTDINILPRLEMVNILETNRSYESTNQSVAEAELDEAKRKRKTKSKRRTSSANRSPVPRFYGAWGFGGEGEMDGGE